MGKENPETEEWVRLTPSGCIVAILAKFFPRCSMKISSMVAEHILDAMEANGILILQKRRD